MPLQPVIFLAFANDQTDYLVQLAEEEEKVYRALEQLHDRDCVEVFSRFQTGLEAIFHHFNRLRERISIFHYGGHADHELLRLSDGSAFGSGLASLMGQQNSLKLVFLNGCSTQEQVEKLLDDGVKAVIATSASINDTLAKEFAIQFYKSLSGGSTLKEAFTFADAYLEGKTGKSAEGGNLGTFRALRHNKPVPHSKMPWGLYWRDDADLAWCLPRQPLPAAGDDLALPPAPTPPLYQRLTKLNYYEQIPLLRRYLRRYDIGAFLIHGAPQYGQTWLGNNILTSLKEMENVDLSPPFRFGINASTTEELAKELKKWLRAGPTFSDLSTEIPLIAGKLTQKLKTQSVVIRVHDVASFLSQGFLESFVRDFWKPLGEQVRAGREEGAPANRLALLLIEEKGSCPPGNACLASTIEEGVKDGKPLYLPEIRPVDVPTFRQWLEADLNDPESVLEDKFFDRFENDDDYREYLDQQGKMAPVPFLEKVCGEFGYYFETNEKGQWVLGQ